MATIKQKKAYNELVENGGNVSKAMRDANYSIETAKTPSKLTNSKGFQELLEKGIKEKHLIKSIKEGLQAMKPYGKSNKLYEDYATRHKYLETGIRLKGLAREEQAPQTLQNIAVFIKEREAKPLHLDSKDITQAPE